MLGPLLAALAEEASDVEVVTLFVGDRLEEALERGEADLAIGASFRERAGLVHRAILEDRFVCAASSTSPIRRLTLPRYLAARHVLVSPRGLPGGIVDDRLAAQGSSRRVVAQTPSFQTALALVARSDLLVTLPRSAARAFDRLSPLRLLAPPLALPRLRLSLAFAASLRNDPEHRWFRERIAAVVSDREERARSSP